MRRRFTDLAWSLAYLALAIPVNLLLLRAFPLWYSVPLIALADWQVFVLADYAMQVFPRRHR